MQRLLNLPMQKHCERVTVHHRQRGCGECLENLLSVVGAAKESSVQTCADLAVYLSRACNQQHAERRTDRDRSFCALRESTRERLPELVPEAEPGTRV